MPPTTTTTTPRRYAAGLAAAAALTAVLAGCGQPEVPAPTSSTVSVAVQPTITPINTQPDPVDTTAAAGGGLFDLSDALTTTSCKAVGGAWSYSGSLRNPGSDDLRATVAITLVKTSDMSVLTTKEVDVELKPGASAPVEAKNFFTDPSGSSEGVECITGATDKDD